MLPDINALLIDLDGVIYRGNMVIPGAAEAIAALPGLGIKHVFVTNNATMRPDEFADKLTGMNVPAQPADIVTSSEATAQYLRSIAPADATVMVVGEEGLVHALTSRGFTLSEH